MEQTIEQRYAIKFCAKLGKSFTQTDELIKQAFGDAALSSSQVSRWLTMFKEGREEVADKPHSGRPSTSHTFENVTRVRDLLNSDRRMSVRLIAQILNLLERLRKRVLRVRQEIAATWVLHHDNAPSHTSLRVREFLAKNNLATLPQPPYSPDLAPADFFCFQGLRQPSKETVLTALRRSKLP